MTRDELNTKIKSVIKSNLVSYNLESSAIELITQNIFNDIYNLDPKNSCDHAFDQDSCLLKFCTKCDFLPEWEQ